MRIYRLAQLFELKYGLESIAASKQETLNQIKKDLINAYNLYVNSETAKEPVLQILSNINEPFSKGLINSWEELIANMDQLSAPSIFRRVNAMLGAISAMKQDPEKTVRNFIHDSVRVTKESERNYREHLKSKFEGTVARLSSILEKQARALQALIGLEGPALQGGPVEPQRKELAKEKILIFMRSPAAQAHGLDSLETMTRLLSYPDLKEKITTLINAVDRGQVPLDGPEVREAARDIMSIYQDREKTNLSALQETPEKSAPQVSLFDEIKE